MRTILRFDLTIVAHFKAGCFTELCQKALQGESKTRKRRGGEEKKYASWRFNVREIPNAKISKNYPESVIFSLENALLRLKWY